MRPIVHVTAAGLLFAALPYSARGGLLAGTLVPVALAVALAIAAGGRVSSLAVVIGAVAAFMGEVGWALAPALGGAILLSLVYVERTLRVRELRARAVHVGLAVVGGASAGALASAYATSPVPLRVIAMLVATVLAVAPLLVSADDPVAVLLDSAAARLGAPLEAPLREGAALHRCAETGVLDRETAGNVRESWRSLERLVEARLRLETGRAPKSETASLVSGMLDKQIVEHVVGLTRAYTAVATKGAAEIGLDDSALRGVDARGEALDEQSRAMVEVKAS